MMPQILPPDWQAFFAELGPGSAAFGLFPLGDRGEQPVLLLHATLEMKVPPMPAVGMSLEWHEEFGVVRLRITMQGVSIGPTAPTAPTITVHDQFEHSVTRIHLEAETLPLRFETFLNPSNQEDRLIMTNLISVPGLYVSLVQSDHVVLGKQFPWKQAFRTSLQTILAETVEGPVDLARWEEAKANVMENYPL